MRRSYVLPKRGFQATVGITDANTGTELRDIKHQSQTTDGCRFVRSHVYLGDLWPVARQAVTEGSSSSPAAKYRESAQRWMRAGKPENLAHSGPVPHTPTQINCIRYISDSGYQRASIWHGPLSSKPCTVQCKISNVMSHHEVGMIARSCVILSECLESIQLPSAARSANVISSDVICPHLKIQGDCFEKDLRR